jgi:hypothetical protein
MVIVGGVATSLLMVVLIGLLARAQYRREQGPVQKAPSPKDCSRLVARARALDDAATARLEAAQRAADTHDQLLRDLAAAEADREEAWFAHSEAAEVHQQAQQAEEAGEEPRISDVEQKEISAAARAAYRRGEISVDELKAVWQRVGRWDDSQEDRSHLLSRLRAEEAEAWRRYHAAGFAERTAQRAMELAEAAARALTDDAAEAARQAEMARLIAADCIARARRRR